MLRTRRFWVTQVLGWSIWIGVAALPRVEYDLRREQAPLAEELGLLFLFLVLGVGLSTLLGVVYDRLPDRWFASRRSQLRLAGVSAGLSIVAAIPCAGAIYIAYASTSWQSPEFIDDIPYSYTAGYAITFLGWSYIYHSARFAESFRRTRERLLRSEAHSQEVRLQALRSQLNAHFLFNSLSSVIGLVQVDPPRAKDMLRDLSSLLRRALEAGGEDTAPLHEEIEFLLQYLRVEQNRFDGELHFDMHIDDAAASVDVPSMLLQPLVENAVKHGSRDSGVRYVEVRGTANDGRVTLEVVNTGSLTGSLEIADDASTKSSGTGLRLVRERLATCYPETGQLDLLEEGDRVIACVRYDLRERRADAGRTRA
ncbi:MAG: histidine kinase [Myxococcota bacterium]